MAQHWGMEALRGKLGDVPKHIIRQLEEGLERWLDHPYKDKASVRTRWV